MSSKDTSQLTDEELLREAKKIKQNMLINATLIGFVLGIIIYGVAKNNLGFFALIPIFIAFKAFNNPKAQAHKKQMENKLKERGLK